MLTYLICFALTTVTAQKHSAQKLYDDAALQTLPENIIPLLKKAIEKDDTYSDAYLRLARQYEQTQQFDLQVQTLHTASKKCNDNLIFIMAQLSKAAYLNGNYQIAQNAISELDWENDDELKRLKNNIDFSIEAVSHPVDFKAINLGPNVNTKYHDYWPSLSIDEREIVTTVFVNDTLRGLAQEDLFYSRKINQNWSPSVPMSKTINTGLNEGAQSLSADGKIMLFTACNRKDGIGACDIYVAYLRNGTWSSPIPLPEPINTEYWEGHPCLSANGKELYFSSDREGGVGGRDLYLATLELGGAKINVKSVENMGKNINTLAHEISPFIHPDGKTLYFSSDGHIGLGRQDIYYTKRDSVGVFSIPENFGYPINSNLDEVGLVVNAQGDRGYFSSEREDSRLKDIYSFDLPIEGRADRVIYFKATIKDKTNHQILNSLVEVRLMSSGEIVFQTQNTNNFTISLSFGVAYAVNVSHPGYLFYSGNLTIDDDSKTPFEKEIMLSPIVKGEKMVLENILFKHDSYELDTSYTVELNKAVELVKNNPKLRFEISGHTDNTGNVAYNQNLSEQRARVVYEYFINGGVAKERLSFKGYGDSQPISDNNQQNRRTELLVK